MNLHPLLRELRQDNASKIVLIVADGLGGLPWEPGGRTELESARTPHLDALARDGVSGLLTPILPGITPGCGAGHLALFGYDPLEHRIGRGILEALGNGVTPPGFAPSPAITPIAEITGLRAAALAVYPMYKGLGRLVGMDVLDAGSTLGDQLAALQDHWQEYDFFYLHYQYTNSTGEDGHFAAKVEMIERLDAQLPQVRALHPDVLVVTGDHSTPSLLQSHSWHPVPVVLYASTCRPDGVTEFGESYCLRGGLGQMQSKYLLPLLLGHAGRLSKYGA